jgi:hypothetical protein
MLIPSLVPLGRGEKRYHPTMIGSSATSEFLSDNKLPLDAFEAYVFSCSSKSQYSQRCCSAQIHHVTIPPKEFRVCGHSPCIY